MKCKRCGAEIADDSKFCEFCGKRVKHYSTRFFIITVVIVLVVALIVGLRVCKKDVEFADGTTWSYTNHDGVKTFFVITPNNDAIWLLSTPQNHMFPVGFGTYDKTTGDMSLYLANQDHEIDLDKTTIPYFNINMDKRTAKLIIDDHWLMNIYNKGNTFAVIKENHVLKPNITLVGSRWMCRLFNEKVVLDFKSWNEVIIDYDGDKNTVGYVLFDNILSIKSGDNFEDENMIGVYYGGDVITLCRFGLDMEVDNNQGITLHKITTEYDSLSYNKCHTIDDFRTYISDFGKSALHYNEAKLFIDKYISDSIAKATKKPSLYYRSYDLGWGSYSGPIKDGLPHGNHGKIIVTKVHEIDLRDVTGEKITVYPGDVIETKYVNGELHSGEVKSKDGSSQLFSRF